MYAALLHEFGPAGNLRYEQVAAPVPGNGEVRVEVRASGVHFIETTLRTGRGIGPHSAPALPVVLGSEVAGVVSALGPDVDDSWLGRPVVGTLASYGGYAEQAVVPIDALHDRPEQLSAEAAVAMVTTGATTLGLLDIAQPGPGDVALVTSAAGGVGALLVQALRRRGVIVVGLVGGPDKVRQATSLGADIAVDYRDQRWPDAVRADLGSHRQVNIVFDGVGGTSGRQAFDLLGPGGRFVLHGWASGTATRITTDDIIARASTVTWALGPQLLRRAGTMRELQAQAIRAAADGALTPLITRYPLSRAEDAHADLENRRAIGKVILVP
ncbi:zinc-binding dehydrogenase [Micromonospora parathelypteridis]|uniref:NADPH2:quinone reductase n=1 Tax=Micromonospora parathelypteridis TaxID=1839617 RepID=A0A840VVR5_9ACTN|nr:zinc-binding dehydrogenase [Micromonospora parathelypteridis]MBB5477088.1 NADPH2:quinone reductase [Micromonospora parathelypteridis]GGO08092.1 oxidoreductase [Micromonospora parathelypteridis]